jgi:hypothetical protein
VKSLSFFRHPGESRGPDSKGTAFDQRHLDSGFRRNDGTKESGGAESPDRLAD